MLARHKAFADIPAFYTDPEAGLLVTNDRGQPATDADVDRFFRTAEPELDRLTLEMCKAERAAGSTLPDWLIKAELMAFVRTRKRAVTNAA